MKGAVRRKRSVFRQRGKGLAWGNKWVEESARLTWNLGVGGLHHMVVMINTQDGKLHHRCYQIRHLCAIRSTAQYIYRLAAPRPTGQAWSQHCKYNRWLRHCWERWQIWSWLFISSPILRRGKLHGLLSV